ncbi:transketolase [Magnetospira sp. QH-2]|uniref:transketolase n=1 Tax=Magnetospira sp. (strain QH-2) TaxID=1288970 RepID=UPI0003E80BDB|nr:transketolase [Magnetospira sp. QH-2]CCQ72163.1 transketolase (N-terminal subunit) [Magnetospira sp. QH-2]
MTRRDPAELARAMRLAVLRMTSSGQASHVGSCLSVTDILATIYGAVARVRPEDPQWSDRDRVIVSKGHVAAATYAVLAELDYFPKAWLDDYSKPGSPLIGHVSHKIPGVELSTGSLGHGLPVACGMALASRRAGAGWGAFVVLSDGELDEGSNWEAALFAAHHRLDNVTAVVDYNRLQGFGRTDDVLGLEPLADKWRAFGWRVMEVDGNDTQALEKALTTAPDDGVPSLVIGHTVKGRGVSFMEDQLAWHYKTPTPEQFEQALKELQA